MGAAGNDTLDGGGGIDTMAGGLGNDIYVVDAVQDVVSEAGGGGRDLVLASVNFSLGNGLDDLTLTGTAAAGTGNAGANLITGNAGTNTLIGGAANDTLSGLDGNDSLDGGTGIDRLSGGLGNDLYRVDNAGDVVLEAVDAGDDVVYASVTYTLVNGAERLILTGTAANGTGNNAANRITGNTAANRLTGGAGLDTLDGGAGADTLVGGLGSDLYVVDNAGDLVSEAGGSGADRVLSSVTFTLGVEVESLTLTGTAAIAGTGNASRNRIDGNAGANLLTGFGEADILVAGAGNDTLVGGAGADRLYGEAGLDVFRYGSAAEGGDLIYGFIAVNDGFQVSAAGFGGGLTVGALPAARFTASSAGLSTAPAGSGGFAYDTDNGRLFWDANGSTAGGATLLTTLVGAPTLTAADFNVIA
ncbi:MAG: calcium-binding protein [Pseudonocardia sp.]|nr:calcium-binding protein [Pseudonocardia sp.]